jgi:hypothetical protein
VTALADRQPTGRGVVPALDRWAWHLFEADGLAHLYRIAELTNSRLELLLPWCLLSARFPLEHDRPSINPSRVIPRHNQTCTACATAPAALLEAPAKQRQRPNGAV